MKKKNFRSGSGTGFRFLAGSGSGFNEYGFETLVFNIVVVLKKKIQLKKVKAF